MPLPYCCPHTGAVSSFVYVTVTFFQTTMSIGWFLPSMCSLGPAVHQGRGEAAAKYALRSSRAPSARVGRQVAVCIRGGALDFFALLLLFFAPRISQHSDSWLMFSNDVTVPSADYSWLDRTSAAALSRTPACMRSHQVHTQTCKLSLPSLYQTIQIDLFNEVQKHSCGSSQNSFS